MKRKEPKAPAWPPKGRILSARAIKEADRATAAAYEAYLHDLQNAWRHPSR